ncbi:hypothetical protein [Aquamicrobium defluvii]|uniref:Uncharacterized protein n=1 Tax=Aquamicrobium defluvii TaxID=69279 RepID=A0A011VJU2_9HYPH|nr:hypothetical protein [Aquamicrobium defluvii]EXL08740.1 hypothetical protein BG36_03600 [Aquamicrobium defluvii]EZQ14893.1 hypothetical protein CF98_14800 [Halopseudomonas bauzanensis]
MSFADIIKLWPTRAALAGDIRVSPQAITNMLKRGSIPSQYWSAMVEGASERGINGVTLNALAKAAAQKMRAAA